MKVILLQDITQQGKQGDVISVADGYARNYLFPRKLAVEAAGGVLKNLQLRHANEERRAEKVRSEAEQTAEALAEKTVKIAVKAGSKDRLYGRITAADVALAIEKEFSVKLDKRKVGLVEPIKAVGDYEIPIKLHRDVSVMIKLTVSADA